MRMIKLLGIVFIAACMLLVTGCDTDGAIESGSIIVGWGQEPDTLNPLTTYYIEGFIVPRALLYDTLISYDENLSYVPWLAKNWEISEDGKVWDFEMVDDAVWHDGEALTAADVKFTVEFIQRAEIPGTIALVSNIDRVEVIDKTNFKIYFREASALTLENLVYLWIVPEHIFKDVPIEDAVLFDNEPPVGSGPFKFISWQRGDSMVFEANNEYWRGAPKSDGVIFKLFPSTETMVLALQKGEIDIIGYEVPVLAVDELEKDENITLLSMPGTYFKEISLNCSDFGKQNNALRDPAVRKALHHAVDKERLVQLIHLGYAEPGVSLVPPALGKWFNEEITLYEFDLEKASKLLEEAGYKDLDGDGIRESAEGVKLEFNLEVLERWPEEMRAAELIADWWSDIGIKLNLRSMDGDTICSLIYPDYEQDMFLWGYENHSDPDFILGVMITDQIQNYNDSGYSNSLYDGMFQQQRSETDTEIREQLVWDMQRIVYEDSPYIVLYYMDAISAYRSDKIGGVKPMIGGVISQRNPYGLHPIYKK